VTDSQNAPPDPSFPSYTPMVDREGEIASRLRVLAASPNDPESLRRGLLWVAGEVQACEQALRQATQQMTVLTNRLTAAEAREEVLARAAAGIDAFRRELVWLSGEVQARGDALTRSASQASELIGELSAFRLQASDRLAKLEARAATGTSNVRDELAAVTHDLVSRRTAPLEGALLELHRELDRVAEEAATTGQAVRTEVFGHVGALDQRVQAVETLQGDLDGVYRELDRVSAHLSGGEGLLSEVAQRLLPLEEALASTRQELMAARGDDGSAGGRIDVVRRIDLLDERTAGVDGRIGVLGDQVGLLAELVDGLATQVESSDEVVGVLALRVSTGDERVAALGDHVDALDERMAALAVLTSDIEGMYRELDRVAELTLSRDGALAQIADRTTPLELAVVDLRQELDRLAGEVVTAQQGALDHVADRVGGVDQRMGPLELLVDQVAELSHELRRVSDEAGSAQHAALAATTEQLGLAGRLRSGEALITEIAERLLPMEDAVVATRQELLDVRGDRGSAGERMEEITLRIDGVGERIDLVDERIDLVDERVGMVGERVNTFDERIVALAVLTSDIEGMYRELDRVAELTLSRDGALAQIADRTTPLEISVANLRQELARLAGEVVVAQQGAINHVAYRVDGVAERMGPLEMLVDQVAELGQELRRVSEEAGSAQQAALAATTEQLGLAGRLRMLESLPADIEGMYRDFERVAEATTGRDDRQADVVERQAAVDAAIEGLRAEIERIANQGQNTELDLRRRLAGLESLTSDLDALYRELGRVTTMATEHDDRSAGFESTVADVRDSLSALRERIEDERIYTTEQVAGLWARMRAVEGVPADIAKVSTDVEKLAEAVSRAVGDSNESVDDVARRVQALETLPTDLETAQSEIGRLAEAARQREEQVAGLRSQMEPLAPALTEVRDEIERMRADLVSAGEARISGLRDEIDRLRTEVASADAARGSGVDERIERLESLPRTVEDALADLTRASEEIDANNQASLANASLLLQDFGDRLRALEALPADMEGLYAALYRVAESVKNLSEDARN